MTIWAGVKVDEQRHEKALALDALDLAVAEDLFEEDALVSDVLIDDPEAFVVDGEDEGVAELAEGSERGEGVEGGGASVRRARAPVQLRPAGARRFEKCEAAGRLQRQWRNRCGCRVKESMRRRGCARARSRRIPVGGSDGSRTGASGSGRERASSEERCAGKRRVVERREEVGGRAGLHERGADCVANEVVHEGGLAEADFSLGRMNVDVNLFGRHLEEEQDDGERCGGRMLR